MSVKLCQRLPHAARDEHADIRSGGWQGARKRVESLLWGNVDEICLRDRSLHPSKTDDSGPRVL